LIGHVRAGRFQAFGTPFAGRGYILDFLAEGNAGTQDPCRLPIRCLA
jgi:hypothetical protein